MDESNDDSTGVSLSLPSGPRPARREVPPTLRARYQDITFVGEGGMGTVYRGYDPHLGRTVAIKLLRGDDSDLAGRFLFEARSQARVQHTNVCRVYDAGEADGEPYIAMQYVEGAQLGQLQGRMTLEQKVKALADIAAAVHEAHKLGLIHRDIKPNNVLVEGLDDGSLKPYIMDFGLVREVASRGQTATGAALGTPAYMAPEQARGELRNLDRRTDVWGLGATLYEVLSGKTPFTADHSFRLLIQVATEEPTPITSVMRGLPHDIVVIVMKCLERDPARRYDSACALEEDLRRFLEGEPIRARKASLAYTLLKLVRKHKVTSALVISAVVSATVLVMMSIKQQRDAALSAQLAAELGREVTEIEFFLRNAYQLPLHDVARERAVVREKLPRIEARMVGAGRAGERPGHLALGRAYFALGEIESAHEHLMLALAAGEDAPVLHYALGEAKSVLYDRARQEADLIEDEIERKRKYAEIELNLRDAGRSHLRKAVALKVSSPAYIEGLIAFNEERPADALAKAREAFAQAPWMFEAKDLEGRALTVLAGKEWNGLHPDWWQRTQPLLEAAERAFAEAEDMARSNAAVLRHACYFWTRWMFIDYYREESPKPKFERGKLLCDRAVRADSESHENLARRASHHANYAYTLVNINKEVPGARGATIEALRLVDEVNAAQSDHQQASDALKMALAAEISYATIEGRDARRTIERAIEFGTVAVKRRPRDSSNIEGLGRSYMYKAIQGDWYGEDIKPDIDRAVTLLEEAMAKGASEVIIHQKLGEARLVLAAHDVRAGKAPRSLLELANVDITYATKKCDSKCDWYGMYWYIEAEIERIEGRDPTESIIKARAMLRKDSQQRPSDLSRRMWLARADLVALRWAVAQRKATLNDFESAIDNLRPFLAEERDMFELYSILAEIHVLRADVLISQHKDSQADVRDGLARAEQALRKNPKNAPTLTIKERLLHLGASRH